MFSSKKINNKDRIRFDQLVRSDSGTMYNMPSPEAENNYLKYVKPECIGIQPLLDVFLKITDKIVIPGGNLDFELYLINNGNMTTNVTINFFIIQSNNRTNIILTSKEILTLDKVILYNKTIRMPENMPLGNYIIEANVTYWYENRWARSADSFDVVPPPSAKAVTLTFEYLKTSLIMIFAIMVCLLIFLFRRNVSKHLKKSKKLTLKS